MIESTLTKRKALYKGEIGFFPSNPMAEEDLSLAKMDAEVLCRWYSPRSLAALNYLWGVVYKTWQNTSRWLDKDEAMEDLKMRARFARFVQEDDGKMVLKPKSLKRINEEELRLLTGKIVDIICAEIVPGMKKNTLRKEVEEMLASKQR
jgi:glutamyl-tRNA reductase